MNTTTKGISRQSNGNWSYRFVIVDQDNVRHDVRKTTDENGHPLTSQKAAIKAKNIELNKWKNKIAKKDVVLIDKDSVTISALFSEYQKNGRQSKAYGTIRKQDSLWKNHLKNDFGDREIADVTSSDINNYLSNLYYVDGYSYRYVESFLKQFYLIFGQAYSKDYISAEKYDKLCRNKDTKISMPKMKVDEDEDIKYFSKEELEKLDSYFKDSNIETAYMLGKYCGLRINECFGLTWDCVDLKKGTIRVEKQMQYQEGVIKSVPLKTRNARRTIYMCDTLIDYLKNKFETRKIDSVNLAESRKQKEIFIPSLNGNKISSLEFVNTLGNGKLQTINSMKFHSRTIKEKFNIDFKYHYLRHTYGTIMATLNTPQHLLCNQMGHGNINVTGKYYIAVSEEGIERLKHNLNSI